jgi:hypothetical protein
MWCGGKEQQCRLWVKSGHHSTYSIVGPPIKGSGKFNPSADELIE